MSADSLRILVSPLDWGLGHASRCIPIIQQLIALGHQVLVAATPNQQAFFKRELPPLQYLEAPSYRIQYPKASFFMPFWLLTVLMKLLHLIHREHAITESYCKQYQIDLVISDNRFGWYSRIVPSVYLSHQIRIAFPGIFQHCEFLGIRLHRFFYRHFARIWIPDQPAPQNLASNLSTPWKNDSRYQYIGWLTRLPSTPLNSSDHLWQATSSKRILVLLSGPEPQRTLLEKKLIECLPSHFSTIILRGLPQIPEGQYPSHPKHIQCLNHCDAPTMVQLISQCHTLLCRAGYTTLMELTSMGVSNAIWVPTPGQTEQQRLAFALSQQQKGHLIFQHKLSTERICQALANPKPFPRIENSSFSLKPTLQNELSLLLQEPL